MQSLIIIDFMYLMHKHMYYVKQQEKMLAMGNKGVYKPMMSNPNTGEETARLFFALRDLEKIVQKYDNMPETHIVVCTDRSSSRKEDSEDNSYKGNRSSSRFDEHDVAAIHQTEHAIEQLGIPVLGHDGYEADDIIQSIVHQYYTHFRDITIYTPDADLAVLIDDKVKLMRYKGEYSKLINPQLLPSVQIIDSHAFVNRQNFEDYFSYEYSKNNPPVTIDYNVIAFYKATVGDRADNIKGITKFGNSAYMKLRSALKANGQWEDLLHATDAGKMFVFFEAILKSYLKDEQYQEMKRAYDLIRPRELEISCNELYGMKRLGRESRKNVYQTGWGINRI